MYYKTASIILNSEQKSSSTSDIFIAQPDALKENLAGKLFILAEVESSRPEALKIVNFLINNISYNYYQNEKILLRERVDNIRTESIFQDSLARTNKDLVEFLSREKIKTSPYAFNITVAVIQEEEIHFSVVGKNRNFLIYKEKTGVIKKKNKVFEPEKVEYKITDIGDSSGKTRETVNMNKLFSDITSGRIPAGGYFLTTNEALSEYVSGKQLLDIVTKLSPAGAAEQIKNTLAKVNAYISFLGIIIKNSTNDEINGGDIKKEVEEKSRKYLNEINAVEKKTEKIMAPSGIINLKNLSRGGEIKTKDEESEKQSLIKKNFQLFKENVSFKKRDGFIKDFWLRIIKAIRASFYFIISLLGNLTDKNKLGSLPAKFKSFFSTIGNLLGKKESEGGLKRKNKLILSAAAILLLIFLINLGITGRKNKELEAEKSFTALIAEIDKVQNKIDANLLYDNENKAKELLEENKKRLTEIPEEKINDSALENIFKRQEEQLEKIKRVIKVKVEKKIADFKVLNNNARAQNLVVQGDMVYLGDSSQRSIYKIDLKEDINTADNNLPAEVAYLDYPAASENEINYLNGENIVILKKDGRQESIENFPLKLPAEENIVSMAAFNSNLYLLGKKQIYRYGRTEEGFSEPSEWLNTGEDLSKIVDIAIDGYIYILKVDGTIKKLLRGEEEKFSNEIAYDPIESANKIITSAEHKYIYVFEPSKNRLVIFDKEGKFIGQYVFDTGNIEDIDVSEKSLKIYLLWENSVYEADLTHIKS